MFAMRSTLVMGSVALVQMLMAQVDGVPARRDAGGLGHVLLRAQRVPRQQ
jgi:hypothetical protein